MKEVSGLSVSLLLVCLTGLLLPSCQTQSEVSVKQPQEYSLGDASISVTAATSDEPAILESPEFNELAVSDIDTSSPAPSLSETLSSPNQTDIFNGWKTYEGKDSGISFRYPSEWGEVINYFDNFIAETKEYYACQDLPSESEVVLEAWELSISDLVNNEAYVSFSNLDKDWGANIRILKVDEIQSMIDHAVREVEVQEDGKRRIEMAALWPFLGLSAGVVIPSPEYVNELPQMLQDIRALPEAASQELLADVAVPVLMIFSNGVRYGINLCNDDTGECSWIDYENTGWIQIATIDGRLRGVIEVGAEGFDTAARDYWDCILVSPDADCLVYISFNLRGRFSSHYDDTSVAWPASMEDAEEEAVLKKQHEILTKFAESIIFLD